MKTFCVLIACLIWLSAYVFVKKRAKRREHRKWMALVDKVKDLHIHIITTYAPSTEDIETFTKELVKLRRKAKEYKNYAREILFTRLEMAEKMLQAKMAT